MARYPAVPKTYDAFRNSPEADRVHREISQWGAALVNQLDTRDLQVDAKPSTNIYSVVTITEVGRPKKGDIVYAASAGKFKGYVSTTATQAWANLN